MAKTVVAVVIEGRDKSGSKVFNTVGEAAVSFGDNIESTGERLGRAGEAAGALGNKLTVGVTAPLTAVAAVSVKAALEAGRFEASLVSLAGGADEAATYVNAIKEASLGTVSSMDAMAIASRALSFGVVDNAEQMSELTEVAITLGRAQGLTATQAVGDLTTALSRQSPMILDNLGITLRLSEAADIAAEHAHEFGMAADELTKAQQFQIAALVKGREVMEQMGGVQDDAAASAERLKAQLSDASVALGQQLLPLVVSGTEKLTNLVASFNAMDVSAQRAVVTLGGVAAATGPALRAFSGIVSVAPALGAGVGNVAAGMQLLAGGASAAGVASLGVAGSVAVALPVIAALTAVIVAAKKAHELWTDVQEHHADVGDTWTQMLKDQVESGASAVELAGEYTAAQQGVNDVLEDTSPVMRLFIDEQEVAGASAEELAGAILDAADSYEDYRAAMEQVGLASAEAGVAIDEMSFEMLKGRDSVEEFADYAGPTAEGITGIGEAAGGASEMLSGLSEASSSATEGVGGIGEAAEPTTESLGGLYEASSSVARSFGEMTFDPESLWNLALASGASAEALGILAQSLGIATGAEVQHTLIGAQLVDQFGRGLITADQLREGFQKLALAEDYATTQAAALSAEFQGAAGGIEALAKADRQAEVGTLALARAGAEALGTEVERREATGELTETITEAGEVTGEFTETTDGLTESMGRVEEAEGRTTVTTDRLREAVDRGSTSVDSLEDSVSELVERLYNVEDAALAAKSAIDAIPEEKVITITYHYVTSGTPPGDIGGGGGGGGGDGGGPPEGWQVGTLFAPGGLALVGEQGPELVALPRGGGLTLVGEQGPELVDLPRGSRVFPTGQTRDILEPDFPKFQAGTPFAPGGLALVGEEGPELVDLPRGSRVSPAARTRDILGPNLPKFQAGTMFAPGGLALVGELGPELVALPGAAGSAPVAGQTVVNIGDVFVTLPEGTVEPETFGALTAQSLISELRRAGGRIPL